LDALIYVLDLIVFIGIFGIMALSLNLEFGFSGLANFGKVAFFLIGAYVYALLSQSGMPFFLCLLIGGLISALAGFLVSLPTLKLREDYLAIMVLTFGEILRLIVKSEQWVAGGVWGITVTPAISIAGASPRIGILVNIALVYFCLCTCFVIAQLLRNSPYGRIMGAIRVDEVAAAALGKIVTK